jgi:predicted pyridoxine 5'-phosphate oxidase superfamily flavin-nucleotide-binding protein
VLTPASLLLNAGLSAQVCELRGLARHPASVLFYRRAGDVGIHSDAAQEEVMTTSLIIQQSLPGSRREHELQERYGTRSRAEAFYKHQMLSYLNPQMRTFIARQEMFFLATADGHGECDVTFRAGEAGFVHVLNEKVLAYPEYRGNGVLASLGNIAENAHAGLLFIDFFRAKVGLHVNGAARILSNEELLACPDLSAALRADIAETGGRRPERWVLVTVEEAYIHCSKHVPRLEKAGEEVRPWGTDDLRAKGGDYFQAKSSPRSL